MELLSAIGAAAVYLLASGMLWRYPDHGQGLKWALLAGIVLQALALLLQTIQAGQIAVGVTEALSLFAWQAALFLWLFCLFYPLHVLGFVVYPVAAAATIGAVVWPSSVTAIPLHEWKLELHVVLSLFSAGFLSLAAVQALTLAIQDRLLHQYRPNHIVQGLPPLQTMEDVLFRLISLGFFTLSLALLSGLLFVDNLLAQHLAHKTVLSITAWAIFGGLLWGRWRWGWRGHTAIRWTLSGYGMLILAYFGSKLVLELVLNRHWG